MLGQTHGFRENFRFNQIIIDDVTIIFYNNVAHVHEQNYVTIYMYMNEGNRSTSVQEICFKLELHTCIMCKAQHLNF